MDSFKRQSIFESEIGSLSLDVDLEVKSEVDSDYERSECESYSEPGTSVEEVDIEEREFSEGESDYVEEEPEVEIGEVTVQQEIVEVPFDPSLLLYVKKDGEKAKSQNESIPEKVNTVTKALRGIKRPPRERPPEYETAELNEQNILNTNTYVQINGGIQKGNLEASLTKSVYKHSENCQLNEEIDVGKVRTKFKKSKSGEKNKTGSLKKKNSEDQIRIEIAPEIPKPVSVADIPGSDKLEDDDLESNRDDNMKESGTEKSFECADCGRKFREKSHLASHSRAHRDVRNFECQKCGLTFKTETNLRFHAKTHAEAPFNCNECQKTFPERKMLKRHLRVVHSTERFGCEQCGRRFKSAANLSLHYNLHTGAKPFMCPICSKGFVYKSTLSAHIRSHETSTGDCEICKESRKCGHNSNIEECIACSKEPPATCTHYSPARPYLCTVCGKAYPLKGTLKNHMKTHDPEKPYKCEECPKTFMKKQSFECHLKRHRGERPEFMCDQCSLSYFNDFALKRHYMKHTSERKFVCRVCRKAFWMKDALKVHMRTHSPVKMFPCSECPKAFSHKHTLDAHARTHYSRPYSCPFCSKSFVHKYNLAKHERQHAQSHTLHVL